MLICQPRCPQVTQVFRLASCDFSHDLPSWCAVCANSLYSRETYNFTGISLVAVIFPSKCRYLLPLHEIASRKPALAHEMLMPRVPFPERAHGVVSWQAKQVYFSMETNDMVAARILESVKRRLAESPYGFQRRVDAAYDNGVLTLSGRVPTFFLKQTAQSLAAKVDGVHQVVNLVDVPYGQDTPPRAASS